jgi:putative PIN family toxin of toxin-antitoxin system
MPSSKKHVLKIVLDTNVWVSALIWGGNPAIIVAAAEQGIIHMFVSESILEEISRVLSYPKITKVYNLQFTRQQLAEQILRNAKFVEATAKLKVIKERPVDDKIIECAVSAKADYIVSGDKHLLNAISYKKIKIVPVSEFIELIK